MTVIIPTSMIEGKIRFLSLTPALWLWFQTAFPKRRYPARQFLIKGLSFDNPISQARATVEYLSRVIGHLDLDYFYAQVEEVEDPSIKGRPVIVCVFSGRTEDSGVVSTSNYMARNLGARSGMPIVTAKKTLEGHNPVVIKMVHEKYEVVSERVMDEVRNRVDILEKSGIDEAFFDITTSSRGDYETATEIAREIKAAILQNERLTCSVGLGRSKVVAKLGSDSAKPGGFMAVPPDSTESFLSPLPVTKLYGVGPRTADTLARLGIKTVGELAKSDLASLERTLGRRLALYLAAAATGSDQDPVRADLEPTQFSRIITLKRDTRDTSEAMVQLKGGFVSVMHRLAESGKSFRTISAIGVFSDLSTRTKSRTFDTPVRNLDTIEGAFPTLLEELLNATNMGLRRVGVRVAALSDNGDQKPLSDFLEGGT